MELLMCITLHCMSIIESDIIYNYTGQVYAEKRIIFDWVWVWYDVYYNWRDKLQLICDR